MIAGQVVKGVKKVKGGTIRMPLYVRNEVTPMSPAAEMRGVRRGRVVYALFSFVCYLHVMFILFYYKLL